MFETTSIWFDLTLFLGLYNVGFILMRHFEVHTPRWRTMLKLVLSTALFAALPRKGINGWAAEPKDKFYALRGWKLEVSK